ncbi:hypothetical protein H311_01496 [Anncaliia algerae PRA109]|nr:hypothetical protein H311_01496 [Anncaliia algerae PRA109]
MFCHKPKNHRGRATSREIWVWGCVDTSFIPAKGHMCIVPDRTQSTLLNKIHEIIKPGTIIWSDEWRGYLNLRHDAQYIHQAVNYSYQFVDPTTGVHTQNIESYWNIQERRIKAKMGIKKEKLEDYIVEWMCKDNYIRKNWNNFMLIFN